jgi:hypothetical protein
LKFFRSVDVSVPAEFAWDRMTDFETLEDRALEAGARVERLTHAPMGEGSRWRVSGPFRGKERMAEVSIREMVPPEMLHIVTTGQMFTLGAVVHVVTMTGRACRIEVTLEARANNLRGRLALRAASLARGRIGKRLTAGLQRAARAIERDYYR